MDIHETSTAADGTVTCTCGMAWHPSQCRTDAAHKSRIARHLQAASSRRQSAARMGCIDPPISEWSLEDYEAFRATGQLD